MSAALAGGDAQAAALTEELRAGGFERARVAIVLGSGLGTLVERLEVERELSGDELRHFPASTVAGHAGRLVLGELAGVRVILQQGRIHLYEGRSPAEVTRVVRALAGLDVEVLLLTNAAGSIERDWSPGELMRIEDHLNLQGRAPLAAGEAGAARIYDAELGARLDSVARELGITLRRGTYAGLLGPSYETPAEIRMLAGLGARAVGMSTVAEASVARAAGLRVAAISCLSNHAAGISEEPLAHEDVLEVGRRAAGDLERLIVGALPAMAPRP